MGVVQLLTLFFLATLAESAEWQYDPDSPYGPANWGDDYPLCVEQKQSPINIVTSEARPVSFESFEFNGYQTGQDDSATLVNIKNAGHTAVMFPDGFYGISGGGLPTPYMVIQAHFHWGVSEYVGSEHMVNGEQFPLEMHIVHYAHERYNYSTPSAVLSEDHDALAVLGVLFEVVEEDNEAFEEVITGVSNIVYEGEEYFFQNEISLYDLLPEDKSRFYRYSGSLTTPECFQVIAWTVFAEPVPISESQIQKFRELTEGARNVSHITGNTFRPVQDLNDRTVYCNSGIPSFITSLTFMMTMLFVNLILSNQ